MSTFYEIMKKMGKIDSYVREMVELEYGSSDLGQMLPQTPVQKPILTKSEHKEDDPIKNLIDNDVTTQEISPEVFEDTITNTIMFPALESPNEFVQNVKDRVNNDVLLKLYWEKECLNRGIQLRSQFKNYISDEYIQKLKDRFMALDQKFIKKYKNLDPQYRGKTDWNIKQINRILDRKYKDGMRVLKTIINKVEADKNDENTNSENSFKSIDKEFNSIIKKNIRDRIHIKEYIENIKNVMESFIDSNDELGTNTIFKNAIRNINIINSSTMNESANNITLTKYVDIIEESSFDKLSTIKNTMLVYMEAMVYNMNNLNRENCDNDVLVCLEKTYNELLKCSAGISNVEDELMCEAAEMEDEIAPIVKTLNEKGYKVKYANPGHLNFISKHDGKDDGVKNNKLYSDAHIQFNGSFGIKAPTNWTFRSTKDGDYLDVKEPVYDGNRTKSSLKEARAKYKREYMASLKKWADALPVFNGETHSQENDPENQTLTESVSFDDFFLSLL